MAVVQVVLIADPESSVSRLEGDNSSSGCDDQQSTDHEEVVSMLERLKSSTETILRRLLLCAIVSDAAIQLSQ